MISTSAVRLALALTTVVASSGAFADSTGFVGSGIDPNTFIVGHPASPRWIITHANQEHPAVVQARLAQHPAIDPNTFTVQPPASVHWLAAAPQEVPQVALATR